VSEPIRWYRAADGSPQVYIKDSTIEEIAEVELYRAGLLPKDDQAVVDIEGFIERHLGANLDVGAELDADVLGLTELRAGSKAQVRINRDLTNAAVEVDVYSGTLGRWRATLAHEAAHVMLHSFLFELNADQETLFDNEPADQARLFRCLKREVVFAGRGGRDPREVQANKGMAALLMPRTLFGAQAREAAPTVTVDELVDQLARLFEVSRQATRIRLGTLGFIEPDGTYVTGIVP
jgi:hypothetical protein